MSGKLKDSPIWQLSLGCFILAALTGMLYRVSMLGVPNGGLSLKNIRHAHSHLMFFGWAVPFPSYILWTHIQKGYNTGHLGFQWMKVGIYGEMIAGLLAYPFFLLYGYQTVPVWAASLPIAAMLSGMVMLFWYVYIFGYCKKRQYLDARIRPLSDAALLLLFICSLGAWGIAPVQLFGAGKQLLMSGILHFFLSSFTEGWVVLILLYILTDHLFKKELIHDSVPIIPLIFIALGAPLTFPFGMPEYLLSPLLLVIARLGGLFSAIGLLWILVFLLRRGSQWSFFWECTAGLLAFKAVMQFIASTAPATLWMRDHGLQIFYLHTLLLGALSLTFLGWIRIEARLSKGYFRMI